MAIESDMKTNTSYVTSTAVLVASVFSMLITGCTSPTPKLDAKEGDAFKKAKQIQQITPTAAQRKAPAPDATSAEVQRAVTLQSLGISGVGGAVGGATGASGQSTGTSTAIGTIR